MLPNEVFVLKCRAYYESIGLVVDATNGEFAHCPYPKGICDTGYYLLHDDHQHQGILQSRDVGQCCFFVGHAKNWLLTCEVFPDNYFELWDIYEMYTSVNQSDAGKKVMEEKDEDGKCKHAVYIGRKSHEEKDQSGKSVRAIHLGKKTNEVKDEDGKSEHAVTMGKKSHAEKDESGKSVRAIEIMKKTNSQIWESIADGFRSNSGAVSRHNRANGWDPNARIRVY